MAAFNRSTSGRLRNAKSLSVTCCRWPPHESPTKGRFGGNKRAGMIYGRLDCSSALAALKRGRTYREHRGFFADEASALA